MFKFSFKSWLCTILTLLQISSIPNTCSCANTVDFISHKKTGSDKPWCLMCPQRDNHFTQEDRPPKEMVCDFSFVDICQTWNISSCPLNARPVCCSFEIKFMFLFPCLPHHLCCFCVLSFLERKLETRRVCLAENKGQIRLTIILVLGTGRSSLLTSVKV